MLGHIPYSEQPYAAVTPPGPSAALHASLTASASITNSSLTTSIRLNSSLTAIASRANASLTTQIKTASTLTSVASISTSSLTTQVRLVSSLAGLSSVSPSVSTSIRLISTLTAIASRSNANLTTDIQASAFISGDKNLNLFGTTGSNARTLSNDSLNIVGDIDIRAKVALDNWTSPPTVGIIGKNQPQTSGYLLMVWSSGVLGLRWGEAGVLRDVTSGVPNGIPDGTTKWVRATMDVDNGSSQRVVKFYLSDDGILWTQLGSTATGPVASIDPNINPLHIGLRDGTVLTGKVFYSEIRNGIDGPIVAKFDPSYSIGTRSIFVPDDEVLNTGTAAAGTSTTLTLAGSATGINDYFNGLTLRLLSGAGSVQERQVSDYDGSTKVVTVSSPWRINLAKWSEDFSQISAWSKSAGVTVTTNSRLSRIGDITANIVTYTGGVNRYVLQDISVSGGTQYNQSIWLRSSTPGTTIRMSFEAPAPNGGTTGGVGYGYHLLTLTSDWTRYNLTVTTRNEATIIRVLFYNFAGDNNNEEISIETWAEQFVPGSSVTEYIKTEASVITYPDSTTGYEIGHLGETWTLNGDATISNASFFTNTSLDTSINLEASLVAVSSNTNASITTSIKLNATPSSIASVIGANLNTAIRLNSLLTSTVGFANPSLSTAIKLIGSIVSLSSFIPAVLNTQVKFNALLLGESDVIPFFTTERDYGIHEYLTYSGSAFATFNDITSVELVGASLGASSTLTSNLNTAIKLLSSLNAASSLPAQNLFIPKALASSFITVSTQTADVTTQISLASLLAASVSSTNSLTTEIELETALNSVSSVANSSLTVAVRFNGLLSAVSTRIDASLSTAVELFSTLSGASNQTASIITVIRLNSLLSATPVFTPILMVDSDYEIVPFLGYGMGSFAGFVDIYVDAIYPSTLVSLSTATFSTLNTQIRLNGLLTGTSTAVPALATQIRLLSSVFSVGSIINPSITTAIVLNKTLTSTGTFTPGPLDTAIRLNAVIQNNSTVSQSILSTQIKTVATLSGAATVAAPLTAKIILTAPILTSVSTVIAPVNTQIILLSSLSVEISMGAVLNAGSHKLLASYLDYATAPFATEAQPVVTDVGRVNYIANSLITANLDTAIKLISTFTAIPILTAPLITKIPLLSSTSIQSAFTSQILTQVLFSSALNTESTFVVDTLITSIKANAFVQNSASIFKAELDTEIRANASISGSSSIVSDLLIKIGFNSAATSSSSIVSELTTRFLFQPTTLEVSSSLPLVNLATGVQFNATNNTAINDVIASLTTVISLYSFMNGVASTLASSLTTQIKIDALASAITDTQAQLTTAIKLASIGGTTSTIMSELSTNISLASILPVTSASTSNITVGVFFRAFATANGAIQQANISTHIPLNSVISTGSQLSSDLFTRTVCLANLVGGSSIQTGQLSTSIQCKALILSLSTVTSSVTTEILLNGNLSASANYTGDLTALKPIFGIIRSQVTAIATNFTEVEQFTGFAGCVASLLKAKIKRNEIKVYFTKQEKHELVETGNITHKILSQKRKQIIIRLP